MAFCSRIKAPPEVPMKDRRENRAQRTIPHQEQNGLKAVLSLNSGKCEADAGANIGLTMSAYFAFIPSCQNSLPMPRFGADAMLLPGRFSYTGRAIQANNKVISRFPSNESTARCFLLSFITFSSRNDLVQHPLGVLPDQNYHRSFH